MISLSDVSSIELLVVAGTFLSFLILIVEILHYKCQQNRKRKLLEACLSIPIRTKRIYQRNDKPLKKFNNRKIQVIIKLKRY